jgi:hypothetical protein
VVPFDDDEADHIAAAGASRGFNYLEAAECYVLGASTKELNARLSELTAEIAELKA